MDKAKQIRTLKGKEHMGLAGSVSDQESGQEGDYEQEEYLQRQSIHDAAISNRAQYSKQATGLSQIPKTTKLSSQIQGAGSKGRQMISAMSQNDKDEEMDEVTRKERFSKKRLDNKISSATNIHQSQPAKGITDQKDEEVISYQNDQAEDVFDDDGNSDDYEEEAKMGPGNYKINNPSSRQFKKTNKTQISALSLAQNSRSEFSGKQRLHGESIAAEQQSLAPQDSIIQNDERNDSVIGEGRKVVIDHLNSQDENQSQSYKGHSNNSPDDLSILTPGKKLPKQLKWILVSENEEGRAMGSGLLPRGLSLPEGPDGAPNPGMSTPQIKNHTATLFNKKLYIFGGYDGKKNHCNLRMFDTEKDCWQKSVKPGGTPPQGRNGHTATLVRNRLYIIGGWLGQGPFAADDMHILDLQQFKWLNYEFTGEPPGPCNMHTADSYEDKIYVFRGGDGRDYLNDLHELNTTTLHWRNVQDVGGMRPPPRANHSSSIIQHNLYIFGGWDGSKRLNDLFVFSLQEFLWSQVVVVGESPAPRAGMELCNVNDKLFLFGGSGPHAFCFNDLYTFDPITSTWEHCNNFRDPEINQNPKARAGHSMTLVDCKLYIIGGSYGQDYLKDVYILDTDPQPDFMTGDSESVGGQSTMQKFLGGVHKMLNNQEFSDVTFMVEDRKFYGHKIIISQLSDKFKAMFAGTPGSSNQIGFKESQSSIINIDNISYPIFTQIMSYLYSGRFSLGPVIENSLRQHYALVQDGKQDFPDDNSSTVRKQQQIDLTHLTMAVDYLIDFLRVADEYLLEDVKNQCQIELIKLVDENTYQQISEMGELYNAERIVEFCQWFQRRKISQYNHCSSSAGAQSVYHSFSNNGNHTEGSVLGSAGRNSLSSTMPQKSKH